MVTATNGREIAAGVERRVEGGVVVLREGSSSVRVENVSPHVVLATMEGRHTDGLARALTAELDIVIGRVGTIHNFYDGWGQDGHDPAIRSHWQSWAKQQKDHLLSTQMLYRPKNSIATMATTVANLVLGGALTIHTAQVSFQSALDAARRDRGTRR